MNMNNTAPLATVFIPTTQACPDCAPPVRLKGGPADGLILVLVMAVVGVVLAKASR
jgi:hypothetical protein